LRNSGVVDDCQSTPQVTFAEPFEPLHLSQAANRFWYVS